MWVVSSCSFPAVFQKKAPELFTFNTKSLKFRYMLLSWSVHTQNNTGLKELLLESRIDAPYLTNK